MVSFMQRGPVLRGVGAIAKDKVLGWQAIVHKQCLPPTPLQCFVFSGRIDASGPRSFKEPSHINILTPTYSLTCMQAYCSNYFGPTSETFFLKENVITEE